MSIEIKDSDNGLGVIVTGRGIVTENEYLDSYKNTFHRIEKNTRNTDTVLMIGQLRLM